jgi:hypothetical protein
MTAATLLREDSWIYMTLKKYPVKIIYFFTHESLPCSETIQSVQAL